MSLNVLSSAAELAGGLCRTRAADVAPPQLMLGRKYMDPGPKTPVLVPPHYLMKLTFWNAEICAFHGIHTKLLIHCAGAAF